jgi:hypothetical protein
MSIIQGSAKQGATRGFYPYEIDGSLRFNDDDSAYLSRTPASAGNLKTWTWSGWVKRGNLGGSVLRLFNVNDSGSPFKQTSLRFDSDQLRFFNDANSTADVKSSAVYRDASAWYHIILAVDTIQGTPANRIKLYVNGEQITALATSTYPDQNTDMYINAARAHQIGTSATSTQFFDGYLAEVNFIDGQALDPSSFGETKSGVWVPKEYTGAHDSATQISAGTTNGFYLKFAGNANDSSGNGNNWTASVGIDTDDDYMADSPTNNWCVLNPATPPSQISLSEGNLKADAISGPSNWGTLFSTFNLPSSGKYYIECLAQVQTGSGNRGGIGVIDSASFLPSNTNIVWDQTAGEGFDGIDMQMFDDIFYSVSDGVSTSRATSLTASAYVLMLAVDIDNGKVFTGYDGTWVNSGNPAAGTGQTADRTFTTTDVIAVHTSYTGTNDQRGIANFGQDSTFAGYTTAGGNSDANGIGDFKYSVPSDYLALSTANLPEPEISPADDESPSDYFNTVTYTGDSAARTITGVGFQPDFLWTKCRSTTESHRLHDVVRGGNGTVLYELNSNETSDEGTDTLVTGLTSDGFTIASGSNTPNVSGRTYVAWNWKAGGTGVVIPVGEYSTDPVNVPSIASTVSANTDSGFSIVTYTGNGTSGATVGHGLGVAPKMLIVKNRDVGSGGDANWQVYHESIGNTQYLILNLTNNASSTGGVGRWNNTTPSSTVFTLGNTGSVNNTEEDYVAYCFAEIEGYSKFGSYEGGSDAFVYTGFRPAMIICKNIDDGTAKWGIKDNARSPYNPTRDSLYPDSNIAAYTGALHDVDFLSNGFKLRNADAIWDGSGTFIYMAFAENPFKYANAR